MKILTTDFHEYLMDKAQSEEIDSQAEFPVSTLGSMVRLRAELPRLYELRGE